MKHISIIFLIQHLQSTLSLLNTSTLTPNQQTTTLPTQTTPNPRILTCNYAIAPMGSFYEMYSLNTCYTIANTSYQYQCTDASTHRSNYDDATCTALPTTYPMTPAVPCVNGMNQCNAQTIAIQKYNQDLFECAKDTYNTDVVDTVSLILNHCVPMPYNTTQNTSAIYNTFNAQNTSIMQYEYTTIQHCWNDSLPLTSTRIPSMSCSNRFYYEIQVRITTTSPTTEPTTEPTVELTSTVSNRTTSEPTTEPTVEPTTYTVSNQTTSQPTTEPTVEPTVLTVSNQTTSQPTTEPTMEPTIGNTIRTRDVIPCDYGLLHDGVLFGTYPMNKCHVTRDISYQYQCINGSVMRLTWNDDTQSCNTSDYDTQAMGTNSVCHVHSSESCDYKWIYKYNRSKVVQCGTHNDGEESFVDAIPFIIDYCIPTANAPAIFNAYEYPNMTQYLYHNISDCVDQNTPYDVIKFNPKYCKNQSYYEVKEAVLTTTTQPINQTTQITPINETMPPVQPLQCNYGLRVTDNRYETLVVGKCVGVTDLFDGYKSMKRECMANEIIDRFYTAASCNGSVTTVSPADGNITSYCDASNGNSVCGSTSIRRYDSNGTCLLSNRYTTDDYITGECILFEDNTIIKNVLVATDTVALIQYSYSALDECANDTNGTNGWAIFNITDNECSGGDVYKIQTIAPNISTTTTTPISANQTTLQPTTPTQPLACNYGVRMNGNRYETLVVGACVGDGYQSMKRLCLNDAIVNTYYKDNACNGNVTTTSPTDGNVTTYCNASDINVCNATSIRRYDSNGTCSSSTEYDTIDYITDACVLFDDDTIIKNVFDTVTLTQYSYMTYDECTNDTNGWMILNITDNTCIGGDLYEIQPPTIAPSRGELDCNYGLLVPGPDDIFYETIIMNECYDGRDVYDISDADSYQYLCMDGVMYQQIFYDNACTKIPNDEERVSVVYDHAVDEYCSYNDGDIAFNAHEYLWVTQYYSHNTYCQPDGLSRRIAFIIGECITFPSTGDVIRNDFDEGKGVLTQFYYQTYDDCVNNPQFYEYHLVIPDGSCPDTSQYYFEIETPTQPTPFPTEQTTTQTPIAYNISGELQCNYGVNYTDFYKTYLTNTCYGLGSVDRSFQFECLVNNAVDSIQVNVWNNEFCFDIDSDTIAIDVASTYCASDKTCADEYSVVWLIEYVASPGCSTPYVDSVKKYAMIIDECIAFEVDGTAFRNKYFVDANYVPQLIQFQYEDMNACVDDNVDHGGVPNTLHNIWFTDSQCSRFGDTQYLYEIKALATTTTISPTNTTATATTATIQTTEEIETTESIETSAIETTTQAIETTESIETSAAAETTIQAIETTEWIETSAAVETTAQAIETTESIETTHAIETTRGIESTYALMTSTLESERRHANDICNYMIGANRVSRNGFYVSIMEDKCYLYDLGWKQYMCDEDGYFTEMDWFTASASAALNANAGCKGKATHYKQTNGDSYCVADNDNALCSSMMVSQYTAIVNDDGVCDKLRFVSELSFIINVCLQYDAENLYISNAFDERNPDRITQILYDSYSGCVNGEEMMDSIEVMDGQCIDDYYYEIESRLDIQSTAAGEGENVLNKPESYYKKMYKSMFGANGPSSIELDVLILVIMIFGGCMCCGVLMWCGWLKGCTDLCWHVLCCGRYSRLTEDANNEDDDANNVADEDTGDESVEMGHIPHVLMPGDNMELAALSEHDANNIKARRPAKENRL